MDKKETVAASVVVSAAICFGSLGLMIGESDFYADAENHGCAEVYSAIAENAEPPSQLEKMEFDHSVWGELARAIQRIISPWLG